MLENDSAIVANWTEQRLLNFVELYLQLEHSDRYQQDTLVTDPVCGARIRKMMAGGKREYCGVNYYFCTESCQQIFDEAPQQYVSHPGSGASPEFN